MRSLAGLTRPDLETLVEELGEPRYRSRQIFRSVQARGVASYEAMTDLSKRLRDALEARIPVRSSRVAGEHDSGDATVKLLVALGDGQSVECVLIPDGDRRLTGCISTQVGCGVGCVFCASGADGVVRNLDAGEIVEQVHHLQDRAGQRLTNLVIMGMGEPLHNVEALARALRLVQDPEGLDLGARRITVSTSGPQGGFEEFLKADVRVKLAISLHASTDDLRRRLVPRGDSGTVADLQRMADTWFEATGRDVTFEYVLLDGINDAPSHARTLARLCGRHRNVNLIPMNPVDHAPELRAPPRARTEAFASILRGAGITVNLRRQRGDDVAAACGQLRLARSDPA